jgi:hypothetical protein
MIWVPWHRGIDENEVAGESARQGSLNPFFINHVHKETFGEDVHKLATDSLTVH